MPCGVKISKCGVLIFSEVSFFYLHYDFRTKSSILRRELTKNSVMSLTTIQRTYIQIYALTL